VFDFTGTSEEIYGNVNAPRAVTISAVIYSLRAMVDRDTPLNQGCLIPVDVIVPQGCFLNPGPTAAVVGGNVLTSQRVTDVILEAFGAAANSQGCMGNLTFGDATVGYYETLAGGAGAGPTWDGVSATQVHMTNTRITDAEVIERRYPVLLREFSIRQGSGGFGRHPGGCGVVRELEFLADNFNVGILSERRALAPRGLAGGGPAQRGRNLLVRRPNDPSEEEQTVSIGGKNEVVVNRGDRIRILTPGGGGYGSPST
jgi:5-oxoprolinase (ATP-hydrolysing)